MQVTSFHRRNRGRGREIPEPVHSKEKVLVHRSVEIRMKAKGMKYTPKAKFDHLDCDWEEYEARKLVEWVE